MEIQEVFPRVIPVDGHTVEPPHVRRDRLPSRYRATGPRIVRAPPKGMTFLGGTFAPVVGAKGEDGPLGDRWVHEDLHRPLTRPGTAVGCDRDEMCLEAITYEQMRPGSFSVPDRLAGMDVNHVRSALCFPALGRRRRGTWRRTPSSGSCAATPSTRWDRPRKASGGPRSRSRTSGAAPCHLTGPMAPLPDGRT